MQGYTALQIRLDTLVLTDYLTPFWENISNWTYNICLVHNKLL